MQDHAGGRGNANKIDLTLPLCSDQAILLNFMEYHPQNACFEALNCHFHGQKWQCKKREISLSLQFTFFLEDLFS